MAELIAIASLLSAFGLYQVQMNKEIDRRLDGLALDLQAIGAELNRHILVSAANQEALEIRINSTSAIMNSQLGLIGDKVTQLNEELKSFQKV